jgi:hypothetical protein
MPPGRKSAKAAPKPPPKKEVKDPKGKEQHKEAPKLRLVPGAGWNVDNFNYLKTLPPEMLGDCIYKMFDIPLIYKADERHAAIKIFVEYHVDAFQMARQFTEIYKSMKVIALLSDYLNCVPSFSSSRDSFTDWVARARSELDGGDFTKPDVQLIDDFIETHLRRDAHIVHFVLTHDIVKKYDQEGLKLFRTVAPPPKKDAQVKQEEVAAPIETMVVIDESLNQAKIMREREIQEQLAAFVVEKFDEINEVLDRRNEQILAQIAGLQDLIDGGAKKPAKRGLGGD